MSSCLRRILWCSFEHPFPWVNLKAFEIQKVCDLVITFLPGNDEGTGVTLGKQPFKWKSKEEPHVVNGVIAFPLTWTRLRPSNPLWIHMLSYCYLSSNGKKQAILFTGTTKYGKITSPAFLLGVFSTYLTTDGAIRMKMALPMVGNDLHNCAYWRI